MSKPKITPIRNVPSRVMSQYQHIESLLTKKDKAIFMYRMGFTPRQITKKLNAAYTSVFAWVKDIDNNSLGVFL